MTSSVALFPLLALRLSVPIAVTSGEEIAGVWPWLERFAGWGVVAWVVYYFVTKSERTQREMVDALRSMADSMKEEGRARAEACREDRRAATDRHCVLLKLAERIEAAVAARAHGED
jgi:hypothetical protein